MHYLRTFEFMGEYQKEKYSMGFPHIAAVSGTTIFLGEKSKFEVIPPALPLLPSVATKRTLCPH